MLGLVSCYTVSVLVIFVSLMQKRLLVKRGHSLFTVLSFHFLYQS